LEASAKEVIWFICSLNPKVSWPGIDLVKGKQKGLPVVALVSGKWGSPLGTGMGRHSGWMLVLASHSLHSRMESAKPLLTISIKVTPKNLLQVIS
jgi:hypothetical protein